MKKKITKVIGVVLAMCISATMLASCGGNAENNTESTSAETELVE